jgi:preprotein translocase subunit YajC
MAGLLILFGGGMWFMGKRSERKEAEEIAALTAHS